MARTRSRRSFACAVFSVSATSIGISTRPGRSRRRIPPPGCVCNDSHDSQAISSRGNNGKASRDRSASLALAPAWSWPGAGDYLPLRVTQHDALSRAEFVSSASCFANSPCRIVSSAAGPEKNAPVIPSKSPPVLSDAGRRRQWWNTVSLQIEFPWEIADRHTLP